MADNYRELVGILKYLLTQRFAPMPHFIRGLLGDGAGNVLVPNRPDYNYARFNRSSGEVFEVFNKEVSQPVDGWPILIGEFPWQPGLTQVVGTDWSAYAQTGWGDSVASVQSHAPTHEWPNFSPGSDYLSIYMRAISPLRGRSGGTGTLNFYVNEYEYDFTGTNVQWPGTSPLALAAAAPATGTMRYMGVYLNPATNALGAVTGSTTTFAETGEPARPNWPLNVFPVAYARLYGGQAYFVEQDIRDARRIFDTTLMFTGTSAGGGSSVSDTLTVKNTSGFTIAANIVGYIKYVAGSGMEFDLSTTTGQACVCVTGGANNATITVATRGRFTLSYSSTAPAAGEFLTIVSGFGTVIAQAYMSPTVMAVAMAAGAGGTVDALLLCHTATVTYTSTNPIMQGPTLFSNSDFNGTIAAPPSGATLTYTVSSGDEKWLDQFSTSELSKLRLYNSTRLTHALISDTDVSTNTITLTANVPAGWVTTDVITIRSPLNTDTSGGAYFMEREFTAEVPELARAVIMDMQWFDTAANGQRLGVHPYEAFSASKQFYLDSSTAHILARTVVVPLIQRRFTFRADASGADTCLVNFYVMGYLVATP